MMYVEGQKCHSISITEESWHVIANDSIHDPRRRHDRRNKVGICMTFISRLCKGRVYDARGGCNVHANRYLNII